MDGGFGLEHHAAAMLLTRPPHGQVLVLSVIPAMHSSSCVALLGLFGFLLLCRFACLCLLACLIVCLLLSMFSWNWFA